MFSSKSTKSAKQFIIFNRISLMKCGCLLKLYCTWIRSRQNKILIIFIYCDGSKQLRRLQIYQRNIFYCFPFTMVTAEEISAQIQRTFLQMEQSQRNGQYLQAEACRVRLIQLKKDYDRRRMFELAHKQKNEIREMEKGQQQEIQNISEYWNSKEEELKEEWVKLEMDMLQKHEEELKSAVEEMDEKIPKKLKESSELLNLRKKEEHMAKQKNYIQAHYIQDKCRKMLKAQLEAWNLNRNLKIQTALKTLKNKQQNEMKALKLRFQTAQEELQYQKTKEIHRLSLKYENVFKELKMQHEKEVITQKGKFKSKGGLATSPSMSRIIKV